MIDYSESFHVAEVISKLSHDPSTQNGAVLAHPYGKPILGTAACNNFPDGVEESDERWERPTKYDYVEHAERNVIYAAAKRGIPTQGLTMVAMWASCTDCARAIIQAGIVRLVTYPRKDSERWGPSIEIADQMLKEAGVEIVFEQRAALPEM